MKNITVYCGSNPGNDPIYKETAIELGKWIAGNGYDLVYGGGKIGLMGVIADTVLDNGGNVTGVIPVLLVEKEIAHHGLTELYIVSDMTARKKKMLELGDAFIALPGGPGSIEEITEAASAARLSIHDCPCILLNVNNYYDSMIRQYDLMVKEGFLFKEQRDVLISVDSVNKLSQYIYG